MGKNFNTELLELLKTDSRFIDSNGELLKKAVIDKAWKTDHSLVKLLLGNPNLKKHPSLHIKIYLPFLVSQFNKPLS